MLTQDAAINIVQNYAREIEQRGVNLRNVIMFGSFAKGTQHEWSDIDVALVADEFTGMPDDYDFFSGIGIKKPYVRIETLTYPTNYFQSGDPLVDEIKQKGVVIMQK
jgi:predicted nucleotidyltransferase